MTDNRLLELMSVFHGAEFRGQESPEKLAALDELQEIDDPRVTEFLVSVAADPKEYDLARVVALRALEIRNMGHAERNLVAGTLARILRDDDDLDARNYAARALSGVMDITTAREAAAKHLFDREEEEDVRHNAFFAIERGALARGPSM
ncbi:MAG: hypothetical protein ACJ76J_08345 [Thermoanaerobaculia bacterium]